MRFKAEAAGLEFKYPDSEKKLPASPDLITTTSPHNETAPEVILEVAAEAT